MKNLKKIFATAIASTMMISCMAINAFAKDSVATLTGDNTGELKAGDVLGLTLTIDDTKGYANIKYTIEYPTDVFTIDTLGNEDKYNEYEEEYDMVPNYFDADWYYEACDSAAFLKKLNTVVYGPEIEGEETGKIILSASCASGSVTSSKGANYVIGKYYLTVKDSAKAGDATIKVTGGNADADLTIGAITCNDLTVKVAGNAPTTKEVGFETTLAYDGVAKGFQFVATNTETGATATSEVKALPTVENLGDVKLGCNIVNVPAEEVETVKSVVSMFARWVAELN